MQIISSRRFLFEKETYTKGKDKDGNETIDRGVSGRIIVAADARPQAVPDWVRDTDLFKAAVDDGTLVEVVIREGVSNDLKGVDNNPKQAPQGQGAAPQAQFVGTTTEPKPDQGGWQTGINK
jgi:hypothetical protein